MVRNFWRRVYRFYVGSESESRKLFVTLIEMGTNQNPTDDIKQHEKYPLYKEEPRNVLEGSGSVVECLTRDRGAAGSSLTGVTALWSLSKTRLS